MIVRDIITLAQTGELRQLSPSIRDSDSIVVSFINLGLIEIYKRFILRTEEALLTLKDGKTIYKLDGTDTDVVNIAGTDIPCVSLAEGRYAYMITAYGTGEVTADYTIDNLLLPINVEDNPLSINTVSYNSVQVPAITQGSNISIIYAAHPDRIDTAVADWDLLEVPVPDQFIEPLLFYIGWRGHGAMDANIQTESNTHYMRFEASCNKILSLGVGITPDDMNMGTRLEQRNFA